MSDIFSGQEIVLVQDWLDYTILYEWCIAA